MRVLGAHFLNCYFFVLSKFLFIKHQISDKKQLITSLAKFLSKTQIKTAKKCQEQLYIFFNFIRYSDKTMTILSSTLSHRRSI